jgi:hypothetical protein
MTAPTIANFFGTNAAILTSNTSVTASAADPVLVIKFSDFTSQEWDALTAGQEQKPEKWVAAITRKIRDWSNANTDDIPNVVITDPIVGLETRESVLKRRFSYSIDIYQPDSGSAAPDPDLI